MTPSTPRRLTRSQTATSPETILGKRGTLSRASSVVSNSSFTLITPESTPKSKRIRTSLEETDPRANKENIPPSLFETPRSSRLCRRSSFSSDISTSSSRSRNELRRHATYNVLPQVSSSALKSISLVTPPATPLISIPLYVRVRGLLRSTSKAEFSMSMEGRTQERTIIESFLLSLDEDSDVTESVLYISGSPGTGKTALVNSIISSTTVSNDVKVLLINCMAIRGMDMLWQRLVEEFSSIAGKAKTGRAASKKQGKDEVSAILNKHKDFKCILVLDELDNLSGSSSNALQPLFALAAANPTKLRIMGIANTHTLTSTSSITSLALDAESTLQGSPSKSKAKALKIRTIHFSPYEPKELLSILKKRFEGLPQDELAKLLPPPALELLSKKVAAITGDVRVLFEVLRGAIDNATSFTSNMNTSDALPSPPPEMSSELKVTPKHILSALKSYTPSSSSSKAKTGISVASSNSEVVTKVRGLSLNARLVLLALILALKRISATLPLVGSSLAFSVTKPPASPTKRSPMKRSNSSVAAAFGNGESATLTGIDSALLHSFYTTVLSASDSVSAVQRSEFTDLLGMLETVGLVSLSAPPARGLKRSQSFVGSSKSKGSVQSVGLQAHVRETEVIRGLGIGETASADGDGLVDSVRSIWAHEINRIRREAKTKDTLATLEGIEGFEDATED